MNSTIETLEPTVTGETLVITYGEQSPILELLTTMFTKKMNSETEDDQEAIFGVISVDAYKRPTLETDDESSDTSNFEDDSFKNIDEVIEMLNQDNLSVNDSFDKIINLVYTNNFEDLKTYLNDIKENLSFGGNYTLILNRIDAENSTEISEIMDDRMIYVPIKTSDLVINDQVIDEYENGKILKINNSIHKIDIGTIIKFYGIMGHKEYELDDESESGKSVNSINEEVSLGETVEELLYNDIDIWEALDVNDACILQSLHDAYDALHRNYANFYHSIIDAKGVNLDAQESLHNFLMNTSKNGSIEDYTYARRLNRKNHFSFINELKLSPDSVYSKLYVSEREKVKSINKGIIDFIKSNPSIINIGFYGISDFTDSKNISGEGFQNSYLELIQEINDTFKEERPQLKVFVFDHINVGTKTEQFQNKAGFDLALIGSDHTICLQFEGKDRSYQYTYSDIVERFNYPFTCNLNTGILKAATQSIETEEK